MAICNNFVDYNLKAVKVLSNHFLVILKVSKAKTQLSKNSFLHKMTIKVNMRNI